MSELQQQITQNLAEAFNLLSQADLHVKGGDMAQAGKIVSAFQEVVSALSQGVLVLTEAEKDEEGDNETE